MTIAEAIREYVNETEGLEFYEQELEKGLGILVKGDNSYMETIMNLTKYFDDHNVDDVNLELEGMYVGMMLLYFSLILKPDVLNLDSYRLK